MFRKALFLLTLFNLGLSLTGKNETQTSCGASLWNTRLWRA
jgi:hypothetical protein